jgi:thiol-disulfide isomerase/thioredoxin
MSKADRNRQETARQRIAAQQAAARQAEMRRRMLIAGGVVALVVIVVLAIVLSKVLGGKSTPPSTQPATGYTLPSSVQPDISSVPASTFAAVGGGTAIRSSFSHGTGATLMSGGKPEMLYIGAEWCPYCAAERWAMAVALSRFGTFSTLRGVHSSSTDIYPSTATLTFYRSTYTSKYLVFTPVENENVNHDPLVNTTASQEAQWAKYEPNPTTRGYPFISIGNLLIATATYNPAVLHGLSWGQIASDLHDPSTAVAKGAVGSANIFTAAICKLTGNQPSNVCTSAPIPGIEKGL